jgi:hypothetical protein
MATHYYMWHCPVCNHGLNGQHRQCLSKGYRFNADAWESDCLKVGYALAEKDCIKLSEWSPGWRRTSCKRAVLPAGTYYIGDGNIDHPEKGRDGCYTNGRDIFVVGRVSNYREYTGSDGLKYYVSSGLLGIFSTEILGPMNPGSYHNFTDMVEVLIDDGHFTFTTRDKKLVIDTRYADTMG